MKSTEQNEEGARAEYDDDVEESVEEQYEVQEFLYALYKKISK